VVAYVRDVLDATHDLIACAKPQSAFFEALGIPGLIALAQVLADAPRARHPVILDAKRGDIGSTAEAYAAAYLADGVFAADALTVNPYLGLDTLEPFLDAAERGGPRAVRAGQDLEPGQRRPAGRRRRRRPAPARAAGRRAGARARGLPADADGYTPLGAVVGATYPARAGGGARAAARARCCWCRATAPRAARRRRRRRLRRARPRRGRQRQPLAALPHRRRRRRRGGARGGDRHARRPQPGARHTRPPDGARPSRAARVSAAASPGRAPGRSATGSCAPAAAAART
jgi:hypothetical protein